MILFNQVYRLFITFILIFECFLKTSSATLYQNKLSDGTIQFSDIPTASAIPVILPPANLIQSHSNSMPPIPVDVSKNTATPPPHDKFFPGEFSIISPKQQANFHYPATILAKVNPPKTLNPDDQIAWFLDGNLQQKGQSTQITLENLTRGEHRLEAKLLNTKNSVLISTTPVVFFVHQQSQSIHEQ